MATTFQLASLMKRERNINSQVGAFSKSRNHSEIARWVCIYPCYLNSKKSLAEGRKVPMSIAVENPTVAEIKDILINAGFKMAIENKVHPRELYKFEMPYRGRVRIQLKNDDGTPYLKDFPTSNSIHFFKRDFKIKSLSLIF